MVVDLSLEMVLNKISQKLFSGWLP